MPAPITATPVDGWRGDIDGPPEAGLLLKRFKAPVLSESISMRVKCCTGSELVDQRPRLADVAARAGVSTASVSLVLRGAPGPSADTRERVMAAAAELS